jgi:hypothetical protein
MARSELELTDETTGIKTLKECHPGKVEAQTRAAVPSGAAN